MIRNKNLSRGAKARYFTHNIDLSAASYCPKVLYVPENDIKIKAVYVTYSVATSSHTQGEDIYVGITSDTDKYATYTPLTSQAIGTVATATLLSTALVAKTTPIIVMKSAATGTSNTGEVSVTVHYELVDTTDPKP